MLEIDLRTGNQLIKLGLNIQYYRKLRSLTQVELSEKANVSEAVIGRIEASNLYANPKTATILKIAYALEISPSKLFEFRDDN